VQHKRIYGKWLVAGFGATLQKLKDGQVYL